MRPRRASRRWGSTARSTRSVPKKLVSKRSRAASIGTSSTLPKIPIAGVAHERVEAGYAGEHQRHRLGDRFLVPGVQRDEAHAGQTLALGSAAGAEDLEAAAGQPGRGRRADPGGRPGDEDAGSHAEFSCERGDANTRRAATSPRRDGSAPRTLLARDGPGPRASPSPAASRRARRRPRPPPPPRRSSCRSAARPSRSSSRSIRRHASAASAAARVSRATAACSSPSARRRRVRW